MYMQPGVRLTLSVTLALDGRLLVVHVLWSGSRQKSRRSRVECVVCGRGMHVCLQISDRYSWQLLSSAAAPAAAV